MLTEGELRLMNVLWEHGSATVKDVVEALPKGQTLAYTTVMTTLQTLAQKGFLKHEKQGRAFVYTPLVSRKQTRQSAINYILSRFFNDSPELLVLNILEHREIDDKAQKQLRKLLKESE